MKTPRDLLLERHRHAGPRLDAIRCVAVASLPAAPGAAAPRGVPGRDRIPGGMFVKAWLELIWPSRHAWGGLAAVWLALLAAHVAMKSTVPAVPVSRTVPARELAQSVEEQRRLLAELLRPVQPPPASAARPGPRPRSERALSFKAA